MNLDEFEIQYRQTIDKTINQLQTVMLLVSQLETKLTIVGQDLQELSQTVENFINQHKEG